MSSDDRVPCRVTRRFDAAPERVFDAWLDPETAGRFLFATPEGEMTGVEIDPRPGGRYTIVERRDGEEVEHVGEYLEVDRPRRLAFTLQVPAYSDEIHRVTVELTMATDGGSQLTLIHEVAPEAVEEAREGWSAVLDGLDWALQR